MKHLYCSFAILLFTISTLAQNYTIQSIPDELLRNSNSVILEEFVDIDASNIRKMKIKTRRVVAVLNSQGASSTRPYEFYNENSRVKKIEAEIYDAFGNREKRFRKKDFRDVTRSGGNMYADSRMVYLSHTPAFYPFILVFESETETGDSGLLNHLWFLHGYSQSLQNLQLKIKFGNDNKVRYKGKNLNGHEIIISEKPNELLISATNIPAFQFEEFSPSETEIFPHVLLAFNTFQLKNVMATVNNWEDFGIWMERALLSDVRDIPQKTISEVTQLISNETTNEGKARKIYQYVQDKVRYVSIQIGIGGWKPTPASEVDKLSYGDCKALTNYTKALLDAVGVPSYYTIVYANENQQHLDEDFASIQGNHVILGIPDNDEITWLECTSQDLPYGYAGSFTDRRNALMITPEGGKLIRTKTYDAEENIQKSRANIQLDSNGKITVKFESTSRGLRYETKYFLKKARENDIDRFYKDRWKYINGFSIIDYEFENNRETVSFTEKLTLNIPNYSGVASDGFVFTPNIFNRHHQVPPTMAERKKNLKIDRGFIDIDTITVQLPTNMKIDKLPEAKSIESEFGKYEISFIKLDDQHFEYHRKLHLYHGEFSPEKYNEYRNFMRSVARLDQTKIFITTL